MSIKRLAGVVSIVLALALISTSALASATPRKGDDADSKLAKVGSVPAGFELLDLDEEKVNLDDYLGKNAVMLIFWSLFCGPCQEELPLIDELVLEYEEKGLEVFAINLDGIKRSRAVQKYMDRQEFSFSVLWEEIDGISYVTADSYGVGGTPTLFIIGKSGKISYVHVGQEKSDTLSKEVIKALAE